MILQGSSRGWRAKFIPGNRQFLQDCDKITEDILTFAPVLRGVGVPGRMGPIRPRRPMRPLRPARTHSRNLPGPSPSNGMRTIIHKPPRSRARPPTSGANSPGIRAPGRSCADTWGYSCPSPWPRGTSIYICRLPLAITTASWRRWGWRRRRWCDGGMGFCGLYDHRKKGGMSGSLVPE